MEKLKQFKFLILAVVVFGVAIALAFATKGSPIKPNVVEKTLNSPDSDLKDQGQVAGYRGSSYSPRIYISGAREGYSSGGLIVIPKTDEPAVQITSYNISGKAEISVYKAKKEDAYLYLLHDKEGEQINKIPDFSKMNYVSSVAVDVKSGYDVENKVLLPLEETGVWLLKIKIDSAEEYAYVFRSNIGVVAKEGNNEFVFWGQDFTHKESVSGAGLKIYSSLDSLKLISETVLDREGLAVSPISEEADFAVAESGGDSAIVPLNLKYLNLSYGYKPFGKKRVNSSYFVFTDRPLYKPGDIVYFKAVIRNDDDARYTIPGGNAKIIIRDDSSDWDHPLVNKSYAISGNGTVSGEYRLNDDASTGYYSLSVNAESDNSNDYYSGTGSSTYFQVEHFRKPDYFLEMKSDRDEYVSADKAVVTVNGSYFSGQPIVNGKFKYIVYSSGFYDWEYYADSKLSVNDYSYGYYLGREFKQGEGVFDRNGQAVVEIDTRLGDGSDSQIFSLETSFDDGSGNPALSRKNIVVYSGQYGIYRGNSDYWSMVRAPYNLPVKLIPHGDAKLSGIALSANIKRETYVKYQEADKKYPSYRLETEELSSVTATTNDKGEAAFKIIPQKTGSYTFSVSGRDRKENLVKKSFSVWVSDDDEPYYTGEYENQLTVKTDKKEYEVGETAVLEIWSEIPDRDVLLSVQRGRVDRYQVVRMSGQREKVNLKLGAGDLPNTFANVVSFSKSSLDVAEAKIALSTRGKELKITLTPDRQSYGPGDLVSLNVQTTDVKGNPLPAEAAIWAVDKAIFELSDQNLGDIFDAFWRERYGSTEMAHSLEGITVFAAEGGGGCFAGDTQVLMADGESKAIQDIRAGEYVLTRKSEGDSGLVKAKVLKRHETVESGYMILNGELKVTPNHWLWINGQWREAGNVSVGDFLIDKEGKPVRIDSVEWQRGKFPVFNLEIEKQRTYFADGVWVHNQKGGGGRSVFKDTAYWNPMVATGADGRARVTFKLPDNLTTWAIAAVGATRDTVVGQEVTEVLVTKDVIVRPIVPNIIREGDRMRISALVQNFADEAYNFDVSLGYGGGKVETPAVKAVKIKPRETQQLYWDIEAGDVNEKAVLAVEAKAKEDAKKTDKVSLNLPVRPFGFYQRSGESIEGSGEYAIKLEPKADNNKAEISLSLSSTLVESLPAAMKYLVDYPYGCVEQTTSRLVPAILGKTNKELFSGALEGKDVDDMINKGWARLSSMQHGDGGWTWWFSGTSDPFVTAYVTEYILMAKTNGMFVDEGMFLKAKGYLEQVHRSPNFEQGYNDSARAAVKYVLALSQPNDSKYRFNIPGNASSEVVAMGVMTNVLSGDKNANNNGLTKLLAMAQSQGDSLFWEGDQGRTFGSRDSSTALAIRAILAAGGDREIAARGVKYLVRSRRFDYWSNTYATVQVARALIDFGKTGDEQSPNYTYEVVMDGKILSSGIVDSLQDKPGELKIPAGNVMDQGSKLKIVKSGQGQLYSTLVVKQFIQDKQALKVAGEMEIEREYVNLKGDEYRIGVGDLVEVRLTVKGPVSDAYYAVLEDELPAGMIPVNEKLKNQWYGEEALRYYDSYGYGDKEFTENGVVISIYRMEGKAKRTYSYRARAVSSGEFSVLPAKAELMYSPEIWSRTAAETVVISDKSTLIPGKVIEKKIRDASRNPKLRLLAGIAGLGLFVGVSVFALLKILKKRNETSQG